MSTRTHVKNKDASYDVISDSLEIVPLSINKAWQGKRFKTPIYSKYIEMALYRLPNKEKISGPVKVNLRFRIAYPKKCDVDNFIKPILDIFVKKGYIDDDRYIYLLNASKVQSDDEGIDFEILPL